MDVWVIYLPGNPLSVGLSVDAVASVKDVGLKANLFEGIEGQDARVYFQENHLQLGPDRIIKWNTPTMGCFASHHSLWKKCVEKNQPLVIMEHDGIMVRNPVDLVTSVQHVCHLDRYVAFNTNLASNDTSHRTLYEKKLQEWQGAGVTEYPSYDFYGETHITGDCFVQAYGYIVTPEGAKRLLAFANEKGAFPADKAICRNAVRLQRSVSTYVKYHPFYDTMEKQRTLTTRR